jgi:hypothetical protein
VNLNQDHLEIRLNGKQAKSKIFDKSKDL